MNILQRYWWNLKTAVALVWYWIAVFFILSVASVIVFRLINPPDILEGIVGLVLIAGFYWKAGAALWNNLPLTEEDIREKRNVDSDSEHRHKGVPGYCHHCQVSVVPQSIDENGMHKKCGESVQVGETTDDDILWDPMWDDEW